jgi:hypothetical protein
MPVPTAKELKKLAKACREAGIHYFKSADFEFTLTGVAPERPSKSKFASTETQGEIESDTLTEEELLYWSTNGGSPVEIET